MLTESVRLKVNDTATLETLLYNASQQRVLNDILSLGQRKIFDIVNFVFLCSLIGVCGIVGNVINIIIFIKQGFKNTVNISFLGLAISDLCCLLTVIWVGVCQNPLLSNVGFPWIPDEFQYLTGAWPHIIFGRVTSYITAYVTAERCLCIAAPFLVKRIITPKRTTLAVFLIYSINILTLSPEYATSYFGWQFVPFLNKTLLRMSFTAERASVAGLVFFLNFVTGMLSFLIVILFTIILVVKLRQTSGWRKGATSDSTHQGAICSRDKKTMKLIVVIATILIVCYTPGTAITMATFVEPEFMLLRRYENFCFAMWSVSFVFQTLNSSINIVLYFTMSTKYRETFYELFRKRFGDNTMTRKQA